MLYRLNQLYNAIFAHVEQNEYLWLNSKLTTKELELFKKQTVTEQRHALDVAYEIRFSRNDIIKTYGKSVYDDLIKAALLHDCGKSLIELKLWQRIFIVIAGYLPNKVKVKMTKKRNLLGKILLVNKLHPAWGKRLASKTGATQNILTLIKNHHAPNNPIELILYRADNRH